MLPIQPSQLGKYKNRLSLKSKRKRDEYRDYVVAEIARKELGINSLEIRSDIFNQQIKRSLQHAFNAGFTTGKEVAKLYI